MDDNLQTDCIFLDYSKAFDRVAHCRLIVKLSALGIDSLALSWIRNFLFCRLQFTVANNFSSSLTDVISGVPQGSVLGPLLFLIYINDISTNLTSSVRLFADDCVVYRAIKNTDDHHILQNDLNDNCWCDKWLMTLNSTKSKVVSFSRKHATTNFPYSINNAALPHASSYTYLGINVTSTLSWKEHITTVCARASKTLGYLHRNLHHSNSTYVN